MRTARIMHLLLEPGEGGLSKFSLLSGRGRMILWQKEIAQKPKNLACLQQQYYTYLERTKKNRCPSLVHNHMSEVQQLFTMKYNHTY